MNARNDISAARCVLTARYQHTPVVVLAAALTLLRYESEIWRPIPGYAPYQASSHGRIKGYGGKVLTPVETQYGYHQVSIISDGRKLSRLIHRLVAGAFLGPAPTPEHDVLHWDGDRRNNHLKNLRWGTPRENNADQDRHARRIRAEIHPLAKLTVPEVLEIRRRFDQGETVMEVSEDFDIHYRTVWSVANRRTWRKLQKADGTIVHTTA